jgi:hypothetical protein
VSAAGAVLLERSDQLSALDDAPAAVSADIAARLFVSDAQWLGLAAQDR